jgi:hypothetical protein
LTIFITLLPCLVHVSKLILTYHSSF